MIPVIDIFAGPGGLNEGFSQVRDSSGNAVFDIRGSFEMERRAVATLTLRAAFRSFGETAAGLDDYKDFLQGGLPESELHRRYADDFARAARHVHQLELGEETRKESDKAIRASLSGREEFVLVGGPPCQAYSLVGRSRRAHDASFLGDKKHFLFKEYLHILDRHRPIAFVMENVKGLLSATHGDTRMFELIRRDLELGGAYRLRSLVVEGSAPDPRDFVIRAEDYGVPQKRHRVILLGLRNDVTAEPSTLHPSPRISLYDAIGNLPSLRSELTSNDSQLAWEHARNYGISTAGPAVQKDHPLPTADAEKLQSWLRTDRGIPVSQHRSRRHMPLDVSRYAYFATKLLRGMRPQVQEIPSHLKPLHKNVSGDKTPFKDRFHVQAWGDPSSTIVAHLSKDGHHFIHPDPAQARSLTVREAARLQTFPDDYWFCGPMTAQFQQVGNAVPPRLAHQIGEIVAQLLVDKDISHGVLPLDEAEDARVTS